MWVKKGHGLTQIKESRLKVDNQPTYKCHRILSRLDSSLYKQDNGPYKSCEETVVRIGSC